jgi:hypothetical protein
MARTHKQRRAAAAATTAALVLGGLAVTATPQAAADDWSRCLVGSDDTQASFARAAAVSGVPADLLLAVGYLGSRWDQHAGKPSTSGGYGPMHLTLRPAAQAPARAAREGRGDDSVAPQVATGTLAQAAEITGFSERRLRTDPVANICGGAAVLA